MSLLRLIETRLRDWEMKPTRFGREAVRDPRFVLDLRNGRRPGGKMDARVRAYIAARDGGDGACVH